MDKTMNSNSVMGGNDNCMVSISKEDGSMMNKKEFIASKGFTHAGVFHSDEVMATAILRIINPNLTIERGFKAPTPSEEVIIYDIGGGEYDHHQKGGEKFRDDGVKYSSVGLIWRDYGWLLTDGITEIWEEIDGTIIRGIDLRDNGVAERGDEFNLGDIIGAFNNNWDESQSDDNFWEAVNVAAKILERVINRAKSKYKAEVEVKEVIDKYDPSTPYIVLERFVPWQDHLLKDERANTVQFVIFPSLRGGWNIQTVPTAPGSRESRKLLPEKWAGETAEKICNMTGLSDAVFCHPGRFMASFGSLESAKEAAKIAAMA